MEELIFNENRSGGNLSLPWDKFSEWVHCIGVVTFDLELGQALEFSYPPNVVLSDKERSNVCYLSFPDSNSGCMGDTQYTFRIRRTSPINDPPGIVLKCNKNCPITLQKENAHFLGFVYFRQVRDQTLRRGYFQKSVVLLTRLPYFTFFSEIVEIIAPEYYDHGETCLETACHDIDQWPEPIPGNVLDLPLLGMILRVRVPLTQDKPGMSIIDSKDIVKPAIPQYILSSINELDIIKCFQPVISHCNLLWELVMLGEPLVVMSSSPETCSNMVIALSLCICPLKYNCDYRPFFTIHDTEFKEYTSRTQAPPKVILGVTNPFFTKTLQHWPHIIRIGDAGLPSSLSTGSLLAGDKLKKNSRIKSFDAKPGLYTEYKVCLKKDKSFLKSLTKPGHRLTNSDSTKLRRYFLELTQSFMIPLERYMATLMPLQKNISPLKAPPSLKPFKPEEFLATVDTQGPHLTSHTKGNWEGLYKRFFNSPNFIHWLDGRKSEMQNKIVALHIAGLASTDIVKWCADKSEVEVVDMILRLRSKISLAKQKDLDISKPTIETIEKQLPEIISSLPEDLQAVLN